MENYEQKYKSALEWMRSIYPTMQGTDKEDAEHHFPELRESEDERIRKAIKEAIENYWSDDTQALTDILAWLEKQSEKIIPKNIDDAALQYVDTCAADGEVTHDNITEPYWNNHSMMAAYKAGWLEKQGEQNTIVNESPSKEMILAVWELGNIWKELTKGSSCTEYGTQLQYIQKHWNESDYYEKLQGEQKFSWSEEDEQNLNFWLDNNKSIDSDKRNWLKSLKDRVQPKQEWGEKDEKMYQSIIDDTVQENQLDNNQIAWLKSLKPNHWKPSEQNINDLEWCADLVKDKMGVSFHRLQIFIDELKNL